MPYAHAKPSYHEAKNNITEEKPIDNPGENAETMAPESVPGVPEEGFPMQMMEGFTGGGDFHVGASQASAGGTGS